MASASTDAAQMKCHLLDLCPELRNYIWRLCTVFEKPIHFVRTHVDDDGHIPDDDEYKPYFEPALARTNHQVRSECLPIFYSENIFQLAHLYEFESRKDLSFVHHDNAIQRITHWRRHLGPSLQHLREVRLDRPPTQIYDVTHLLSASGTPANRVHYFSAKLHSDGTLIMELLAHDRKVTGTMAVTPVCLCGLKKFARARGVGKKRPNGKVVLDLASEVSEHYDSRSCEVNCKSCGLEVIHAWIG
ncbi:unnamed protein product [Zymoseptoria tritici ST99CH_1E4]|uniref:Uncharacterized protein n=1 Tax=Zymoseptoria tritici ST99CH_1E4 TaxID=1276532 RepID=A0A2H1GL16_ZYMTR|nr:unnamed protein product [Zymoseptoria tritici ST99CH_1E4]